MRLQEDLLSSPLSTRTLVESLQKSFLEQGDSSFLLGGAPRNEVFSLAAAVGEALEKEASAGHGVCLAINAKEGLMAALLTSLAGGPPLTLPHTLSLQVLTDVRDTLGCRVILADHPLQAPSGMKVVQLPPPGSPKPAPPCRSDPDLPFLSLFTGGSTGRPKVWEKTPRNIFEETFDLIETFQVRPGDVVLATVPAQHIYGLLFSVLVPFVAGAQVLPQVLYLPNEIRSALTTLPVTLLASIPAHYRALRMASGESPALRLAFSSGGFLDDTSGGSFTESTGVPIAEIYGSTETGGIASRRRALGEETWTSFPKVSWKVRDDRLCVASPYLSPSLPRDEDGFFITGDRAKVAGVGRFHLLGRADGVVKVAGKRVDLAFVEQQLKALDGVKDAFVLAIPVPGARENDIAALVVSSGTTDSIRAQLAERLPAEARPRRLRVVEAIPLSRTGKCDAGMARSLLE